MYFTGKSAGGWKPWERWKRRQAREEQGPGLMDLITGQVGGLQFSWCGLNRNKNASEVTYLLSRLAAFSLARAHHYSGSPEGFLLG